MIATHPRLKLEPFSTGGKPTLIIDMDGVSCGFLPAVCREHNLLTGGNLKPEDITDWDMSLFGIEKSTWQKPGLFRTLEPIPGAIETLYKIRHDYRLTIATDCMGVDFVQSDKQCWLDEHMPFIDDLYFTSDKSGVPGDLLFDDAAHHLESFPRLTVKMLTPYNRYARADFTVENWRQFERLLRKGIV
jgi:5'-nucleotidase